MSDCERITVNANVELTFEGCREHGDFRPLRGHAEMNGAPSHLVIDGLLVVILEAVCADVEKVPVVQDFVRYQYPYFGDDPEILPERARDRLIRLIAHSILSEHVTGGKFIRDVESMSLSIPMSLD